VAIYKFFSTSKTLHTEGNGGVARLLINGRPLLKDHTNALRIRHEYVNNALHIFLRLIPHRDPLQNPSIKESNHFYPEMLRLNPTRVLSAGRRLFSAQPATSTAISPNFDLFNPTEEHKGLSKFLRRVVAVKFVNIVTI